MPLISLHNVTKAYGNLVLVEDASLSIHERDRLGVVGANGAGKTTLLRLLAGEAEPTRGEVHLARGLSVGFLAQEPDFAGHGTVLESALSAFARLNDLEDQINALRWRLAENPPDAPTLLRRQGELEAEFERLGGYGRHQRAEAALAGVGLRGEILHSPVERLSGGERSRLAIAHLLLQEPDVLLMDEPTNHLDVEGLEWLEEFLRGFRGAAVVVSHDRRFLDGFAQRVAEVRGGRVEVYRGNYSAYARQRGERVARQEKLYERQQARVAKEQAFIQRYIAGQRGREARGRRKKLERLERLERPTADKTIHLRITPSSRGGNEVVNLEGVGKEFDSGWLFRGLTLQVLRGERIGVVGPNGAGKTTLLRLIAGEIEPSEGSVRLGHEITVGYHRQGLEDLSPEPTVLESVWSRAPGRRGGELRHLLGLFLFGEEEINRPVGELSGGERARLALARLILSGANLLLLDEPTNHLDIPSRLALEEALLAYEGTTIVVSHDRYLLERVAEKIVEIGDGRARLFHGAYSFYRRARRRESEPAVAAEKQRPSRPAKPRTARRERKPRPLDVLEKLIIEREEAVETLHHAMSDPEIYKSPETIRTLAAQLEALKGELQDLYDEWDAAAEAAH